MARERARIQKRSRRNADGPAGARDLTIRRAQAADLPEIAGLWWEYANHHRRKDPIFTVTPHARADWSSWMRKLLRSRKTLVLVAQSGGRLVGFSSAQVSSRPPVMKYRSFGAIFDFAVTQKARRKGVGRRLFGECKRWFLGRGIHRIELRVVPRNPQAAGFWAALGFRPYVEVQFLEV
jgi:ribosomal protein S18 acetylase RimI-like enzyme